MLSPKKTAFAPAGGTFRAITVGTGVDGRGVGDGVGSGAEVTTAVAMACRVGAATVGGGVAVGAGIAIVGVGTAIVGIGIGSASGEGAGDEAMRFGARSPHAASSVAASVPAATRTSARRVYPCRKGRDTGLLLCVMRPPSRTFAVQTP